MLQEVYDSFVRNSICEKRRLPQMNREGAEYIEAKWQTK